jgi:uncharacterized protein YgiM (DUF1202 family)
VSEKHQHLAVAQRLPTHHYKKETTMKKTFSTIASMQSHAYQPTATHQHKGGSTMKKRIISIIAGFCLLMSVFAMTASASTEKNYGAAVTTNQSLTLNVRSGAGTNYGVIDSLPPKSYVSKISASSSGFTRIEYTSGGYSKKGWVSNEYLKALPTLWVADVVNVSSNSVLNVRKTASTSSAVIATLRPGARVVVDLLITTQGWCRVYCNSTLVGYVSTTYISTK